jgi:hypothetical protein
MKFRLTAKSYNYKGREYHKGDVIELDSIEQIPVIFRQFFTIVEDDKVNNVADKVIDNKNTEDTTTTEIKEEAKSDTTAKKVTTAKTVNKVKK